MKKTLLTAVSLLGFSAATQAAVTLTFSAVTGAGNGVLTGLASSENVTNVPRIWGILVDSGNDGFSLGDYKAGASLVAGATTTLETYIGGVTALTNDVLYIAPALMVNSNNATLDGGTLASGNLARPTTFTNIPTPNGSVNQSFYLVWFDEVAFGGTTVVGGNYGAFRLPSFVLPADGASTSFASNFTGADQVRPANLEFQGVPEPSAALLGAIGALGLLRRRRI